MAVYLDGKIYRDEEATVSVFDHGFLYGDGVFEGIRVYEKNVFKLKEHLDRLYDSAKAIRLEIPMVKEEMSKAVVETVKASGLANAYIRLVISRGKGDLGLDPRKCARPTVAIIVSSISLYPQELYEKGITMVTVPTRRNLVETVNPRIKSLNYLNNIMGKIESTDAGAAEGLMLNNEGYVAECTGDNIFIVKDRKVMTPPFYAGALGGVTALTVLDLAREKGYQAEDRMLTRFDVYSADECFLTGSAAEIIPVTEVDKRQIGTGRPGPVTKDLITAYRGIVNKIGTKVE